ncbi:hypothetical protein RugamoR64_50090 [Duganella rhizosphaerae]|uniref:acyl carrier protein n=1 Tax=Duganella rhizosphaerae TaxID=2885763 RepID=UPI0030E8B6BF
MSVSNEVMSRFCQEIGLKLDFDAVDPAATLQELGVDSMSLVQLMYTLEDEFGVTIGTQEMLEINTVGALSAMLRQKMAGDASTPSGLAAAN